MASGKQHFVADMIINGATLTLLYTHPEWRNEILIGNLIGTLLTPDIDNESGTYNEVLLANFVSFALTKFGRRKSAAKRDAKIIYRLQTALTSPYGVMIPHRSWLSHGPLIGTLTITFYLWLVYAVAGKVAGFVTLPYLALIQTYQVGFGVIMAHHIVHLLMDGCMILFFGKQIYLLTYPFYFLTTKLFPQGSKD